MAKPSRPKPKPARRRPRSLLARISKMTAHPVIAPLIVAAIAAVAAGILGYIKLTSGGTTTPVPPPTAPASTRGFNARVAWTDDGGGGGSTSTNLYAFTGPNSDIHDGVYTLGESLTVVCETPHGRAIAVGPAYNGPDPHSTIWYELDNDSWAPAVYVYASNANTVPACS